MSVWLVTGHKSYDTRESLSLHVIVFVARGTPASSRFAKTSDGTAFFGCNIVAVTCLAKFE